MFNIERDLSPRNLLRAKSIDYVHESEEVNGCYNSGTVVLSPIFKGLDLTIAHSMRRILLGASYGYAIIAFQIDGVLHEFSNITGVVEDVLTIALNLKKVRLKSNTDNKISETISIELKGPCEFTAGMIEEFANIKVINKDHVICTINRSINLSIKFIVAFGYNYVQAESFKKSGIKSPGLIYIDALFNPIKNVSFSSEDIIVNSEEYKKLYISVETDGTIDYREALFNAANLMKEQLFILSSNGPQSPFSDTESSDGLNAFEDEISKDYLLSSSGMRYNMNLFKNIHEIEMPIRAHNAFVKANIVYLGDLINIPYKELISMSNLGRKSLELVSNCIMKYNLRFDMNISPWPPVDLLNLRKQYEARMNSSLKKKINW
jgi:DNA-directed RNA polymerase subunit alpha